MGFYQQTDFNANGSVKSGSGLVFALKEKRLINYMKNTKVLYFLTIQLLVVCTNNIAQVRSTFKVTSPDKNTFIEVGLDKGKLLYRLSYGNNAIIKWSDLGFVMNDVVAGEKTLIKGKAQRSNKENFTWPLGENDNITNNYNEITLSCQSSSLKYNIKARVFDGSVAFRYEIPTQSVLESNTIRKENTEFNFSEPYTIYQYNQESVFIPVSIDTFTKTCDFPATLTNGKLLGLKAKLDIILPLYKKWGVSGLKFGFVDGLTQGGLTWLAGAIKKVNDYGFILDIHDNYKPTGLSRTYPALLTQEGIRGDENSPDAFHTTVLPFTRFLAGPADFTFCYPNSKNSFSKNLKVSKGQQLALTVIYFSLLQSIFWYGNPNDYTNEEEIEFFKYVPTVWNESHYLAGDIGKNISVARRKGNTWYVGSAAGLMDWQGTITLDFLTKGNQII